MHHKVATKNNETSLEQVGYDKCFLAGVSKWKLSEKESLPLKPYNYNWTQIIYKSSHNVSVIILYYKLILFKM